jgi:cysteine desulfurase/selenocysteine lyase
MIKVVDMNIEKIREDFPVLNRKINSKPIIYFDNACMTLKPRPVIESMNRYYNEYPACAGRSNHKLARQVTEEVESSRKTIQKFFSAKKESEIIFTRNTTEGINLIANSFVKENDIILTTDKEHNSNLLPWQARKVRHIISNSKSDNTFDIEDYKKKIKGARLVSMVHTSNLDGTTIPEKEIIKIAHANGAYVMLDAAQSAGHREIDVRKLDVDFLACSLHKMLGPTGMGVLYGKQEIVEEMQPFMMGGETVTDSTYTTHKIEKLPERFEAGLQNYAGIIGAGEAVRYLSKTGLREIEKHENDMNKKLTDELAPEVKIIGPADSRLRSGIFSFIVPGADNHEIALMLDNNANIMIRSGAHCVHSWFNARGLKGSCRASLYLYNMKEECDIFIEELKKILKIVK